MDRTPKCSPEIAKRFLEAMRNGERSANRLSRDIGVPRTTLQAWIKAYVEGRVQETATGFMLLASKPPTDAPPHVQEKEFASNVNVPIDNRGDEEGETLIVTPDKPLTLDDMYALFKIDRKVWIPVVFTANQWQGFYKAKKEWTTPDGPGDTGTSTTKHQKVALWQTRVVWKRILKGTIETALLDFMREKVRPLPVPSESRKKTPSNGQMVSWGLWDAHLGLYAWQAETGQNMDLRIGINRVCNSIDDMAAELCGYPIERIVMPVGNDFLHYDNVRQHTTHGEHHLDADGRFAKVYAAGLQCLCYMVERAMEICPNVDVLYIPGNHDLVASYTLCVAMAQRYLNDPRVKFDLRPNPRKYVNFGGTLLGFDHGQGANANQLSTIFPTECAEFWSRSTYREIQVGHTHQRKERSYEGVVPLNGITIRTNPSLSSVDTWHHTQGLIGEPMKSVEAWRYDRKGYRGSHVAWARDDHNNATDKIPLSR